MANDLWLIKFFSFNVSSAKDLLYPDGEKIESYPNPFFPIGFFKISPSTIPSKVWILFSTINAITVLNLAFLFFLFSNFLNSFSILSFVLHLAPAYLAEWTPGSPFKVSTSNPVSSEKTLILNLL